MYNEYRDMEKFIFKRHKDDNWVQDKKFNIKISHFLDS